MGDLRISTHPVQCQLHHQGDADHARLSLDEIGFLDNWEAGAFPVLKGGRMGLRMGILSSWPG